MPRRLAVDDRRQELLRFGEKLFAAHPVDAFSMAEIAEQAGVSKALLYHYFGNRRGYYVAVMQGIADQLRAAITPEPEYGFDEAFERALARYLTFAREHPDVFRVLVQGGLGVDAEVAEIVEGTRRAAADFVRLKLGVKRPNAAVRIALAGWVAFAERACLTWLEGKEPNEAAMKRLLVDALAPVRTAVDEMRGGK
ncbi:MAG: TetR/AcrR family transcriptional regulator [Sandaracinus sp.]|nr:TetR/AcrR family transcriptional regulator [Sandaracinus sp.]MCB9625148.1 TetR/AcrR family transcriptional regulator [Sandaracinus sp.]